MSFPDFFYVGKETESQETEKLLTEKGHKVVTFRVKDTDVDTRDDPRPPCLITGDGRFSGLAKIQSYLSSIQTLGGCTHAEETEG